MGSTVSRTDMPSTPEEAKIRRNSSSKAVINLRKHFESDLPRKEFQLIEQFEMTEGSLISKEDAKTELSRTKNRYISVLPFDKTRVKLSPVEGEEESDYINASFIKNGKREKYYIATQGPIPNTIPAFWKMTWEQDSAVVVMLTREFENGRMKCHIYWPEKEGEEGKLTVGDLSVELISEKRDKSIETTIRRFKLTKEGSEETKEVVQFQYLGWPDHDVPEDTKQIRTLLKKVNSARRKSPLKGPIIAHCSAGIGRTGTFFAINSTLLRLKRHLKRNKGTPFKFTIYKTVLELRKQRTGMVQQPEQYLFVFEAVLDEAEELGLTFDDDGQIYKGEPLGQIRKSFTEEKDGKDSHSNETREDLDDDEDED